MNVRVGSARLIRIVAILACLTMIVSFAMYGFDQASGASRNAQVQVSGAGGETLGPSVKGTRHTAVRRTIDDANNALSAPFASLVPSESSWGHRIAVLLIGLLLYGFGLGALARVAALSRLPTHDPPPSHWAEARFLGP